MHIWAGWTNRIKRQPRRRAVLAAVLVVVPVALGSVSAAAAPIGTGSISGRVVDSSGHPIAGICVNVEAGSAVQTDGSGDFVLSGLETGSYQVAFRDCTPAQQYVNQWYLGRASSATADPVAVTDGIDTPLPNVTMATGSRIEGTVRGPGGVPLAGICIDAYVPNGGGGLDWLSGTSSGPGGTYALAQLPATGIRVQFRDCNSGPYLTQWYDAHTDANDATPVVLAPEETRTGIDAQLATGVAVSGRVTDANGNPRAGINVNVNPIESGQSAWGQTDSAGRYTTNPLPPGNYRVQFNDSSSPPTWAAQYWSGKLSYSAATVLTLAAGDAPARTNVNATLTRAAAVSGTLTKPGGGPVANICVNALVEGPDGADWLGSATTAPDGTYTIGGLAATDVKIYFEDCNDVGPYVGQFWKNAATYDGAVPLSLKAGVKRSGVNAQLAAAAVITGTVTDLAGDPIENICAQATTSTFVGGMARTESDGRYAIKLAKAGAYKVQFVDCSGSPRFAGEWFDNQPSASTAQPVHVGSGQTVDHVDAALRPGTVGSISGRVTNLNGVAMTTACVVAYVPSGFATFAPVNADGTYSIPGLPSGLYAIAFLGCDEGREPGAVVRDPESAITSYQAVWWHGAALGLNDQEGGPDPIAQGATLVRLDPGQQRRGYDWCFGCTAINIETITPGNGSLTVAFSTTLLLPAGTVDGMVSAAAAGDTRTYTVTCTSSTGGVTGSASGPSSPITVTGLTPGATYTCHVTASDGMVMVAASPEETAVVSAAANGASSATPSGSVSVPFAAAGSGMARTGIDPGVEAGAGFAAVIAGLALIFVGRVRRPARSRARD